MSMYNFTIAREEERMLKNLDGYAMLEDLRQLAPFGNSARVFDTHYLLAFDLCGSISARKLQMKIDKRGRRFFIQFFIQSFNTRRRYVLRNMLLPEDCVRKEIRYKVVDNILFVSMPRRGGSRFSLKRILRTYGEILSKFGISAWRKNKS